ncbi:hypothetical protein HK104_003161 [Borealophlyctis nickersoniae]|nr:hypothetical protein HK104_003161 [Borealophlyctis nickersoniae]
MTLPTFSSPEEEIAHLRGQLLERDAKMTEKDAKLSEKDAKLSEKDDLIRQERNKNRDLTGTPEESHTLPDSHPSISVPDLIRIILDRHPPLTKVLDSIMLAVNLEYVDLNGKDEKGRETVVKGGDEVALIPPVSGG